MKILLATLVFSLVVFSQPVSAQQYGVASWYGGKFHGRRTASGAIYNQDAATCAHRTLPFGTNVRITNTSTGRSIVCRVTDRGPFIRGRIIDVSRAVARGLGMDGLAQVRLEVIR